MSGTGSTDALVLRAEEGDLLGEGGARWFDAATVAERAPPTGSPGRTSEATG